MAIRYKMSTIVVMMLVIFIIITGIVSYKILPSGYEKLQSDEVNRQVHFALSQIETLIHMHDKKVHHLTLDSGLISALNRQDYRPFDEIFTLEYMEMGNISHVLVYGRNGGLSYSQSCNKISGLSRDVPEALKLELLEYDNKSGLLNLADKDYIITMAPFIGGEFGKIAIVSEFDSHLKADFIDAFDYKATLAYPNFDLNTNKTFTVVDEGKRFIIKIQTDYFNKVGYSELTLYIPTTIRDVGFKTNFKSMLLIMMTVLILAIVFYIIAFVYLSRVNRLSQDIKNVAEKRDFSMRVSNTKNDEIGGISSNINTLLTRIESMIDQLKGAANIDGMTGALTRIAGLRVLEKEISKHQFAPYDLTICYVDIDNLKTVNDSSGHSIGDEYIKRIIEILFKNTRITDTISRLGGDEFLIILPNCTKKMAELLMERVLNELEHMNSAPQQSYQMSFSYGVAKYKEGMDTLAFLELADTRMYKHKKQSVQNIEDYIIKQ